MKKERMVPAFSLLIITWAICTIAQNRAPVAVIKVTSGQTITDNRIQVNANEQVCFDGSLSIDPDKDALTYSWNFGDGTAVSASPAPCHTYTANGTYTVQLTVDDGKSGPIASLLYNKIPSNFTLPSGWSLGCEQDFETPNLINQWNNSKCKAGDATSVWSFYKQTTEKAHTGTASIYDSLTVSGNGGNWGASLSLTAKEVYLSFYTNNDSFPNYGGFYYEGGDYMIAQFRAKSSGDCLLNFCCGSAPKGSDSANIWWQTEGAAASTGSPSRIIKKVFTDFDGHWHQWEIHYRPNTQTGGTANSDGVLQVWHDGDLWVDWENYNLNGTDDMTGMSVCLGGSVTAILWLKNATSEASCNDLIAKGTAVCGTGGFGCANGRTWELMNSVCPGSAPPHPFKRYADDEILLYR